MSAQSGLSPKPPRTPKRVPWILMAILWAAAVVQIFAEFFTAPHTLETMRLMSSLTFIFVGSGCAALCAWLIQRSTVDPYQDYVGSLDLVHKAGYDEGFPEGYDRGYRDGRAASLGVVRLGSQPTASTQDERADTEDPPAGGTGTDGSAPR